jgi:phage virion morphogenesis protein
MAGAVINISLEGADLAGYLSGLGERLTQLREPFDEIGAYLVSEFKENMQQGVSPEGENWGSSNPSRRAREQNGQTLIDRGHLRDSNTHIAEDSQLQVGSALVYAAIHQLGGKSGRGHKVTLPARPWMGWNDKYGSEAGRVLIDYLMGE